MSGPIVRSGPSAEFSSNWSDAFGKKETTAKKKVSSETSKTAKKKTKKTKKTTKKKKAAKKA